MLSEIKTPGVNRTFALDFARIYWTDSEWVEQNLAKIFSKDLWDGTWGTYVSWGRISPKCFELLLREGLYLKAVEKIGSKNNFKFGKEPDKGLVEHLMIGYFGGWIEYDSEELRRFFEKAPAELRGKAARFLTTGLKDVNEEGGKEKEKVASRMREYWNKRLAAIKEKPNGNEKEVVELAG